jgi:hypothetical protein
MPEYSIKIQSAEKITVQDTGEHLLSVLFDIQRGDEVMRTARHGFPLGITVKELELELQGVLAAFIKDTETSEATADFEARNAQADQTIAELIGKEITN